MAFYGSLSSLRRQKCAIMEIDLGGGMVISWIFLESWIVRHIMFLGGRMSVLYCIFQEFGGFAFAFQAMAERDTKSSFCGVYKRETGTSHLLSLYLVSLTSQISV